jgi:membrane protease YdiL (CAAX protease family)
MTDESLALRAAPTRRRIIAEILIVLAVSLGASAVYSIVQLVDLSTRAKSLSQQTQSLNNSLSDRQVFDFTYQFLQLFFDLAPVALVCYLLWQLGRPHLGRLGLDFRRPVLGLADAGVGIVLALAIGLPGIVLYLVGRLFGLTVNVVASPVDTYWWTIPILLFSALRAGLQEEVIVIGYLYARLRDLGWGKWTIILSTSILRGSYHLYQGYGAFVGNFAMGVLFGWLYTRFGRLLPFVIAHFLIDAAIFVGYPLAAPAIPAVLSWMSAFFGLTS